MKLVKKTRRYCPYCKKHTEQKVSLVSSGHKRGSMKRGGKSRVKKRGQWRGSGNLGRYSKPPITAWKRKTKSTKKTNILYTCAVCKKSTMQSKGIRSGKITFEEKAKTEYGDKKNR
ncbi:MAG: 50S ribosomal protein L44e [archaeon]